MSRCPPTDLCPCIHTYMHVYKSIFSTVQIIHVQYKIHGVRDNNLYPSNHSTWQTQIQVERLLNVDWVRVWLHDRLSHAQAYITLNDLSNFYKAYITRHKVMPIWVEKTWPQSTSHRRMQFKTRRSIFSTIHWRINKWNSWRLWWKISSISVFSLSIHNVSINYPVLATAKPLVVWSNLYPWQCWVVTRYFLK